jgi:hypothetical protein
LSINPEARYVITSAGLGSPEEGEWNRFSIAKKE